MNLNSAANGIHVSYTGRTLGKYIVRESLHRGRLGEVYRAFDADAQRDVAVKIFYGDSLTDSADFEARFRAIIRLEHPNILRVFDCGTLGNVHYIVTDRMEGPSLRDELGALRGGIDSDRAVSVTRYMVKALAYAHEHGVIHGDIKPSNINMRSKGGPLLFDFGLAQAIESQSILMPVYLSPEQADGSAPTAQSDIYSLGIVFYEMLTGQVPFAGGSPADILRRHCTEQPKMPSELGSNISHHIEAILMWMLAKDPSTRPSSAQKLIDILGPDVSEQKYTTFVLKKDQAKEIRQQVAAKLEAAIPAVQPAETDDKAKDAEKGKGSLAGRLSAWLRRS